MQPTHSPSSPFPAVGPEKVDTALLLATLPNLSTPHFLSQVITCATSQTRERLIIVLFSRHFNVHRKPYDPNLTTTAHPHSAHQTSLLHALNFPENQGLSHTEAWDAVQRILTFAYVQATKVAQEMNKVLMDIDILLKGLNEDLDPSLGHGVDIVFRVSGDSIAVPLPESISFLRVSYLPGGDRESDSIAATAGGTPSPTLPTLPSTYSITALGGTFDHLHAGHKILLSMGAWITDKKLIVGITEDTLLQNKSNKQVLENISTRTERVRAFLTFCKPQIIPEIVPIHDVYGPTGWDPNIQALVVSKETLSGADAIAKHRKEKNLPPLQNFLIDVISATEASLDHADSGWLKEHKLSSTFIRQWIVDQEKEKADSEAKTGAKGKEGEGAGSGGGGVQTG